MWLRIFTIAVPAILSACGYVSKYEEQVYDWEPVYCYQSIGGVECFKEPRHSDSRRLVNYYGPDPSRYDAPDAPDVPELQAPQEIDTWVKDAEPVPQPALTKEQARSYDAGLRGKQTQVATAPKSPTAPAAPIAPAAPVQTLLEPETRKPSFFEKLRRSIFGRPELANEPL